MREWLMKKYAALLIKEMAELCEKNNSFVDALAVNAHCDEVFTEESNNRIPVGTWDIVRKIRDEYN